MGQSRSSPLRPCPAFEAHIGSPGIVVQATALEWRAKWWERLEWRTIHVMGPLLRSGVFPVFRHIGLPDKFLDAGALPTLHDRYGISVNAVCGSIKDWLK